MHISLVGMMGAGKSSVGRLLAQQLGRRFVDTDARIVAQNGITIAALFEERGEAAFRTIESDVIEECLADVAPAVLSLGGGAVLGERNRIALRSGSIVAWLRATPETLLQRVGTGAVRPLLAGDPEAAIRRIDAERRPLYALCAHVVVDVDELRLSQVADCVRMSVEHIAR